MYISLAHVDDLPEARVREALGGDMGVTVLEAARRAERVDYGAVRLTKNRALRFAFERFTGEELPAATARAQEFEAFVHDERHWLEDYALFRVLKDDHDGKPWWEWERLLRDRDDAALSAARGRLEREIQYYRYVQWLAHAQWDAARAKLHAVDVEIMGDLPFVVGRDSADVWSHAREFRHDADVGAPPDQFNDEGQAWGLPPYRWDAMRANDFAWLRRRARYAGSLYDRFRIDHLVGFYRTFLLPLQKPGEVGKGIKGTFDPADERAQLGHGERVIAAMIDAARERDAVLVAEDLGVVPDFVRTSLTKLGVLGYKVLIWEKDGDVFRDPAKYPELSLACFGTHDTDAIAVWWETRTKAEHEAVLAIPSWRERAKNFTWRFTPGTHRALLDLILSAPSRLVLLLMQDLLATRERINTPATTGPQNWTYRLRATIAELREDSEARAALETVRHSVAASGR
jgi:4-alpha-glucanotransferase